jgi:integrase
MSSANPTPRRVRVPGDRNSNIYKRYDGQLEVGYRDSGGKQRWIGPYATITLARVARDEVLAKKGRGEIVQPNPRLRFGDAADAWWEAQAMKLRKSTQNAYGASLTHLRAEWGTTRLDAITASGVADFIGRLERAGYKGWTLRGHLTVLGRVFAYAIRYLDWHGANPVPTLDKSERPKSDARDKRILSGEELQRLLAAIDPEYALLFAFTAATGCRLGEALGLRWHGVDLDAGHVHFSHQLDRQGEYAELKTKRSRRTIEVPPSLVSALIGHKLASPFSGDHDYVFANRVGGGHDHRNIGGRVLARAVRNAGLEAERKDGHLVRPAPTFHSLRHTHGSALIAAGWDLEEVSSRLGHRDTNVTAALYIHAYESSRRSQARAERLEAMYGSGLEAVNGSAQDQMAVTATAEVLLLSAQSATR